MSSAVAEARRVLKRGGLLLDVHPADESTSLQVWHARFGGLAELPENLEAVHRAPAGFFEPSQMLDDFTAATDALTEALETGFSLQRSTAFDYYYSFDTLDELTDYIEDNYEQGMASDALLERAAILMRQAPTPPKLVVVQKVALTSLRRS